MFHERHQQALDRHAQLIEDARAVRLARTLQGTRRWQFTWRLRPITLHLPLPQVTPTRVGPRG